jgi:opacity protein-like surface antigen
MRSRFALLASSVVLLTPAFALAQEGQPGCPPGGWFCEETEPPAQEPEAAPDEAPPAPEAPPPAHRRRHLPPQSASQPPPVVVYEPPPAEALETPPPPQRRGWHRKWALNLRLDGVLMGGGKNQSQDAGMGGLGFSFRYRPIGHFAIDAGLDWFGGVDWAGNDRRETAFTTNAMVFFNPRDAVQVYMLGGLNFSEALVQSRDKNGDIVANTDRRYSYFGGQMGLGLEFRVSNTVSLDLDVVGFIRGRTDDAARQTPEFTDPDTGRTTNTSGGGLFRGGITFYW